MSIPFIRQYPANAMFPTGRRALSEFACSPEVEGLGRKFIALEGAYVCEILPDGKARIAACQFVNGVQKDVEVEVCDNGPGLPAAVERVIRASVAHVDNKVIPIKGAREARRRLKLVSSSDGAA